jgi:hypothetical protein
MKKNLLCNQYLLAAALTLSLASSAWANSSGAPTGTAGAPGEDTCATAGCHSTSPLNSGPGRVNITFPSGTYTPGQTVRVRVTVEDPAAVRWGFNLTVRRESSNDFVGAFAVPATPTPAVIAIRNQGAARYVTHSPNGTFRAQTNQAAWEVDWTAPAAGSGPVRFYVAGNAANNNGANTGDRVYTSNLAVAEATSGPPAAITSGNTVLPQFVFGGGWSSSLYFTNPTASQVSFPVRFYNDSAAEMSFGGSATRQLIIPARGTTLIQAQNTGSLSQGWATFDLPTGVVGYGVFRQAVPGIPDQEAVVPFASGSGTRASLTYDESNLVTAAAVWYNGNANATVTILARDESGAQIGTSTLTMTPGTKQAFAVTEKIPAIGGKRGVLEFTTSGGNISVLGLRFSGSAFTSIPAAP